MLLEQGQDPLGQAILAVVLPLRCRQRETGMPDTKPESRSRYRDCPRHTARPRSTPKSTVVAQSRHLESHSLSLDPYSRLSALSSAACQISHPCCPLCFLFFSLLDDLLSPGESLGKEVLLRKTNRCPHGISFETWTCSLCPQLVTWGDSQNPTNHVTRNGGSVLTNQRPCKSIFYVIGAVRVRGAYGL